MCKPAFVEGVLKITAPDEKTGVVQWVKKISENKHQDRLLVVTTYHVVLLKFGKSGKSVSVWYSLDQLSVVVESSGQLITLG